MNLDIGKKQTLLSNALMELYMLSMDGMGKNICIAGSALMNGQPIQITANMKLVSSMTGQNGMKKTENFRMRKET